MIAACKSKEHPYDIVLVWKFSRFARNQEESIVYKRLLKKCNVEVVSISEPLPDGFVGELVERIFEWMDEYYSINLSAEVVRGMTQKALQGGYQGSIAYGYIREKDDIPIVNQTEATIVKLIFDIFSRDGYGIATTARYLNEKGIKTRKGKLWDSCKVKYILSNPIYIGKVRWNYKNPKGNTSYKPEEEWIIVDGKHEPIISNEQFNFVQQKIKECSKPGIKGVKLPHKHYLSGILKCAACGGNLNYRSAWKGRAPYFVCRNNQAGTCKCSQYTKVDKLESQFLIAFKDAIDNQLYKVEFEKPLDFSQAEYLNNQLENLEQKEARIKQAYRDGIDSLEEYKNNKNILIREREKIISKMNNLPMENETNRDPSDYLLSIYDFLQADAYTPMQKNEALKKVLPKIIYDRDTQLLELHFVL